VANSLHNLGRLYLAQQRYTEAEPLLSRALAISENRLGPDHLSLADLLQSYALLLRKTKRKAEASILEARAKVIIAKCGPDCQKAHTVDVQALQSER
jgi:tetratricopeptide (TPR) repeat protein